MPMTAALRDRLELAAVAGGRVYRDERPAGTTLPAIRLQMVSDPRPSTYEGRQDLRATTVQIDCMALSRGAADQVAEDAISAAEGEAEVDDTHFLRSFVDSARTYSERDSAGILTFITSLDMIVWHKPAA